MKRVFICLSLLAAALFMSARMSAGNRPITADRLPRQAQAFLAAHFSDVGISYATADRELFETTYDVALNDGTRIEFGRKGEWREIKSPHTPLPRSVVPRAIAEYVTRNYPKAVIRQLEYENGEYEVELSNGIKIDFGSGMQLLRSTDYTKPQPDHRLPML